MGFTEVTFWKDQVPRLVGVYDLRQLLLLLYSTTLNRLQWRPCMDWTSLCMCHDIIIIPPGDENILGSHAPSTATAYVLPVHELEMPSEYLDQSLPGPYCSKWSGQRRTGRTGCWQPLELCLLLNCCFCCIKYCILLPLIYHCIVPAWTHFLPFSLLPVCIWLMWSYHHLTAPSGFTQYGA